MRTVHDKLKFKCELQDEVVDEVSAVGEMLAVDNTIEMRELTLTGSADASCLKIFHIPETTEDLAERIEVIRDSDALYVVFGPTDYAHDQWNALASDNIIYIKQDDCPQSPMEKEALAELMRASGRGFPGALAPLQTEEDQIDDAYINKAFCWEYTDYDQLRERWDDKERLDE